MSAEVLEKLRGLNPALDIKAASDPDFATYGRLVEGECIGSVAQFLRENTPIEPGVFYTASEEGAEALPACCEIRRRFFGDLDIQIGWCNGTNAELNALEYHASVELNIAATDCVLLLARAWECGENKIDGSLVRGFYLEAGQAVLLHSSTLHFAPCAVSGDGFCVGVVLPRGSNTALEGKSAEDAPLWMKNKWLFAHAEAEKLVSDGAQIGLVGRKIRLVRESDN